MGFLFFINFCRTLRWVLFPILLFFVGLSFSWGQSLPLSVEPVPNLFIERGNAPQDPWSELEGVYSTISKDRVSEEKGPLVNGQPVKPPALCGLIIEKDHWGQFIGGAHIYDLIVRLDFSIVSHKMVPVESGSAKMQFHHVLTIQAKPISIATDKNGELTISWTDSERSKDLPPKKVSLSFITEGDEPKTWTCQAKRKENGN